MFLLVLVLGSNFLLYRSPISLMVLPEETKWVILGSLIDLAIVSPLLVLAIYRKKNFSVKRFIIWMAGGLVLARFLIPAKYFEQFVAISYIGFAIEGLLVLFELTLLFMLVRYMPAIIQQVRMSDESLLFSFPNAVEEKVRKHPIVQIIASELLMFYYAFSSWKKSSPIGDKYFTLHKNSSLVAFQIMMIHAIIIETIGIHWWLHDQSMLLSILLLILNVYSILFFLGDIQAVRLNPLKMTDNYLYLSLGLAKKMVLSLDNIASITIDQELLEKKIDKKTTIEFIARDFETVHPHMILELKNPCRATLFLGIEKTYMRVALRMDNPTKFYEALKERISK
ncbi:beta-carotene 15,15'-monooxygenase (plasmid) [Bacillus methanolicus]|nr:beta-carotene 15,15'-monooxygenase [Bacillus methanolicus]